MKYARTMDTEAAEVGGVSGSTLSFARFFVLAGSLCLTACANPGPPRPPSLQLPEMVTDLSAERIGDRVLLRWTTPERTTDDFDMKGAMTAEICRSVGPPSPSPKKPLATCVKVQTVAAVPGASMAFDDLPQTLLADPITLLTYRIQILNAAGRSAGRSTLAAYTAGGAAPPPVDSLTAIASEAGAIIQWKPTSTGVPATGPLVIDLSRADLTSAATTPKLKASAPAVPPVHHARSSRKGQQAGPDEANEVHVRAAARGKVGGDSAGTVDTTATMGGIYSYVAQQVRPTSINGHSLEIRSLPSPAVTLAMRDTFPPKTPTGLATIPGTTEATNGTPAAGYIDLSWEPNAEPDFAGYLVYRQLARHNGDPQGPLGKLTPVPIAAPAYRDVAVAPGQRYIYSITAVDASGNESAPSAKAQEVAAPQNVGRPR